MAYELLRTFLASLEVFRPAVSQPGFRKLVVLATGWILTVGSHAVTAALVATRVAGRRHHEAFHRFFSRGTWSPDAFGKLVFLWARRLRLIEAPIRVVVDDTLAPKKGRQVFGIANHLDAVRSTRRFRVFCFGHCWVVLSVLVRVPFSRRPWALPVLLRLYRNKSICTDEHPYRKKTELGREMVQVLLSWADGERIELAADALYANDTVIRDMPDNLVFFGSMRSDAALTDRPDLDAYYRRRRGGRKPKRGERLPTPEQIAADPNIPWQRCSALLYGNSRTILYKTFNAQWYRACGARWLRIVIVKTNSGALGIRVFYSTDSTLSVPYILERYAGRWGIEVCFRNLKQEFGFADSSARSPEAVLRTAPFAALLYSVVVIWFIEHVHPRSAACVPVRPWYPQKRGFSFEDVVRTARQVLSPLDVLDPVRSLDNLRHRARPAEARPFPASSADPPFS